MTSIRLPDLCYSPKHPCMFPEGIDCACKLMEYAGELFGGFSSEDCYDFTNKYLDYGLYVAFGDGFGHKKVSVCDRFLPVWELVYHGTVLYNPLSTTINYPVKTKADRLCAIMRGGRPSLYVNSRFRTGAVNRMGETDLTSGSKEELERAAKAVAEALDEYGEEGARRRLLYMTRYEERENGIICVTYSDGTRMVGNNSERVAEFEGIGIEAYGYCVTPF